MTIGSLKEINRSQNYCFLNDFATRAFGSDKHISAAGFGKGLPNASAAAETTPVNPS